jgi:hypothetical protein
MQIGWISPLCSLSDSRGLGDDIHSWGIDGFNSLFWNGESKDITVRWKKFDVLGCLIDIVRIENEVCLFSSSSFAVLTSR